MSDLTTGILRHIRPNAWRSPPVTVLSAPQPLPWRAACLRSSVDQDLPGLGFWLFLDRHLEHAVLIPGLDIVLPCVVWQLERPANRSIAALGHMDFGLIGAFGALALRRDRQPPFLNARIDGLALESRHVEVKMVRALVLRHVDRWHHVPDRRRGFPDEPVRAVEQPTIARP